MSKSSNLTAGDGLSLAADLIKLLAPVLKETDKAKFESLKKNSRMVQDVFRRLLNGEPIVKDYGDPYAYTFVAFQNKTSRDYRVELNPDTRFVIQTYNVQTDCGRELEVRLQAYNVHEKKFIEGWEHKFEKLMPMLGSDGFVSITTLNDFSLFSRTNVQDKLIAERAMLVLHDSSGDYHLEIKVPEGRSFLLHEDVPIDYQELMALGVMAVGPLV